MPEMSFGPKAEVPPETPPQPLPKEGLGTEESREQRGAGDPRRAPADAGPRSSERAPVSLDAIDVISSREGPVVHDGGFVRAEVAQTISVFPADPGPTTARSQALPLDEYASDAEPVSLRDLGVVLAPVAAPPPWRPQAAPSPAAAAAPAKKPSFFDVDLLPAAPSEPPPSDKSAPNSGMRDILAMTAQVRERQERAGSDLLHLSGGLFGDAPAPPLGPPDLSLLSPPEDVETDALVPISVAPVIALDRLAPRPAPPGEAASAPQRASRSVAPAPVVSERSPRGQGTNRAGIASWVIAAAAVCVAAAALAYRSDKRETPASTPASVVVTAAVSAPTVDRSPEPPPSEPVRDEPARDRPSERRDAPARTVEPAHTARERVPVVVPPIATPPPAQVAPPPVAPAPAPAPAPTPVAAPPAPAGGEFDRAAAKASLAAAAAAAAGCRQPDDPSGGARVSITFAPSGRVTSSSVSGPPFQGTKTGACIAGAFRRASVPPFSGDSVTVNKEVSVQ
jgi:hypothetical protein